MARIIQIVPKLPPNRCGVGDHAFRLGELWRDKHDVAYCSLHATKPVAPSSNIGVCHPNANALVSELDRLCDHQENLLLLHFSGYSYAKWGLCFWLERGLRRFLKNRSKCRLITMYHELWANGSWLSTAGWTYPFQRQIALSLCKLSQRVRTNRHESMELLAAGTRRSLDDFSVYPVFSNFGEPQVLPDWDARNNVLLLFQPPSLNRPLGIKFWEAWEKMASLLKVDKTVVAGLVDRVPDSPAIEKVGFVSVTEAAKLLMHNKYSMMTYYAGYYAKSSILAALAAYGLGCIFLDDAKSESDGLIPNQHYWLSDRLDVDDEKLKDCGNQLRQWYLGHSLESCTRSYNADFDRVLASIR